METFSFIRSDDFSGNRTHPTFAAIQIDFGPFPIFTDINPYTRPGLEIHVGFPNPFKWHMALFQNQIWQYG